jgi:hypothetical protein
LDGVRLSQLEGNLPKHLKLLSLEKNHERRTDRDWPVLTMTTALIGGADQPETRTGFVARAAAAVVDEPRETRR